MRVPLVYRMLEGLLRGLYRKGYYKGQYKGSAGSVRVGYSKGIAGICIGATIRVLSGGNVRV